MGADRGPATKVRWSQHARMDSELPPPTLTIRNASERRCRICSIMACVPFSEVLHVGSVECVSAVQHGYSGADDGCGVVVVVVDEVNHDVGVAQIRSGARSLFDAVGNLSIRDVRVDEQHSGTQVLELFDDRP